jgi:hypothetical protein
MNGLGNCEAHCTDLERRTAGATGITVSGAAQVGAARLITGEFQLKAELDNWQRLSAAVGLVVEAV